MAFSADEGKEFFKDWLKCFCMGPDAIKTILDIGAGAGVYANILEEIKPWLRHWGWLEMPLIDAVEIYEPYVDHFALKRKYHNVFIGDATEMELEPYDLIILGDVFEHLHKFQAMVFWQRLIKIARFIYLSIPVKKFKPWFHGYIQTEDDWKENISEKHLYEWGYKELLDIFGPFTWQVPFRTIVVLIAEGERKWQPA